MKSFLVLAAVAMLSVTAMAATPATASANTTVYWAVPAYVGITSDATILITGTPTSTGVTGSGIINFTAYANCDFGVTAAFVPDGSAPSDVVVSLGTMTGATGTQLTSGSPSGSLGTCPVSVTGSLADGVFTNQILGVVTLTIAQAD